MEELNIANTLRISVLEETVEYQQIQIDTLKKQIEYILKDRTSVLDGGTMLL